MKPDISSLLKKYDLRPKKGLGQNFLSDPNVLKRVVAAGGVTSQDVVLEIGPGLGSLTLALAHEAKRVVAVEIDERMLGPLEEVLGGEENVRVVHGDVLEQDIPQLMAYPEPYVVVANIPYYITSPILRHLLESGHPPVRLALTVQREVAERIVASPPEMSLLALSVQVYGAAQIAFRIPAGAFTPRPKVDSAVVRVDVLPTPRIPAALLDLFFRLARAGFSQKRKTLRNSISAGMHWGKDEAEETLRAAAIDPMRRAETLSMEEWELLTGAAQARLRSL